MTPFDQTTADQFLVAVRAGASNDVAATHAGIQLAVVRKWLASEKSFADAVDKARADLELLAIGSIRRGVGDDRQSAMWLAERMHGEVELERLRNLTT